MNSASQDFPHHLGVLRERMLHSTDFELAVNYFLEEFAGDREFVRASDPEPMPQLVAVLGQVVSRAIGRRVELEGALVSYLRAHQFVHGNAQADGRVVLFFYFQDADAGMMMLIPGVRGEGEVARFRLTAGLPDPQKINKPNARPFIAMRHKRHAQTSRSPQAFFTKHAFRPMAIPSILQSIS